MQVELFDIEVMDVIARERLLDGTSNSLRVEEAGWFRKPGVTRFRSDFMATYLFRYPQQQAPWDANISSMINALVNDILTMDCQPLNAPVRYDYVFILSKSARQQASHLHIIPNLYPSQDRMLFLPSYQYHLISAKIMTGRPVLDDLDAMTFIDHNLDTRPDLLGTLLNSAIWGRQYTLIRHLLQKALDSRKRLQFADSTVHYALEAAALNGDLKAVQLLLEPIWQYDRTSPSLNIALEMSLSLGHHDIAEYLTREKEQG
ncbi:hypothetical protein K461DRAFT_282076 [Myriangium duriaei CBS 260.36]|uniref:Uncharacterized protein n=1 Tax=Myriangium duriaei CBS 260.36 TaxID=1168546 RepID=A0A9P4IZK9_9PEZI|nr:hypothetical protein K461DRAFT_282076 [Myriangium duriaei CBS 260.36]